MKADKNGGDNHISRIADIVGLNASTLRFWEKENLIRFERNSDNNYRRPSVQNLLQVWDILMFRSLGIPIAEIKSCFDADIATLLNLLDKSESATERRIRELEASLSRIAERKSAIRRVEELLADEPVVKYVRLPEVRPLDYADKSDMELMIADCTLTGLTMESADASPDFVVLRDNPDTDETLCLVGLLAVRTDAQIPLNADALYAAARALGYECGRLTGRYLATATERGIRQDFMEACLEVRPRGNSADNRAF